MGNSMDYIYTSAEQKILIEVEQKSIRQSVIEQYIPVSYTHLTLPTICSV